MGNEGHGSDRNRDKLATNIGGQHRADFGKFCSDKPHGNRRTHARRKSARGNDTHLLVASIDERAFAHRLAALYGKANALPWRAIGEVIQNAFGAGEAALFPAALGNGESQIAFNRVCRAIKIMSVERQSRFQPQ